MPITTLRDLYIAELQDLYDAEQQVLNELPTMSARATSSDLREAFDEHLEHTRVQAQRLELVLHKLGIQPGSRSSSAMCGLIEESRHRIAAAERGDVRDAALIGAAQRIAHHEIAVYGCARTYARTLGDDDAADLLQQTLEEEGKADHRLSRLAEHGINQAAAQDVLRDVEGQRARLQYVPASALREFRYREYRIRGRQDEDLGSLDGFVVDGRSARPVYFVIDSGGWFVGRRYLVPIGALEVDEDAGALSADLDRTTIERYPPFNPAAFSELSAKEPPAYDELPEYRPPTWLMTGVWMTEGSGFASVPPRAASDLADTRKP